VSESPRVVEWSQTHGSGEHPFERTGLKGVNLICDDQDHDRQFVGAVIFDEATGFAVPIDGKRHTLEGPDGAARSRWKFRCVQCHRAVVVRSERLDGIIAQLIRHAVSELSLRGLDGILRLR
jgi:hypothetical protein